MLNINIQNITTFYHSINHSLTCHMTPFLFKENWFFLKYAINGNLICCWKQRDTNPTKNPKSFFFIFLVFLMNDHTFIEQPAYNTIQIQETTWFKDWIT